MKELVVGKQMITVVDRDVKSHYANNKEVMDLRMMTHEEAQKLKSGQRVIAVDYKGLWAFATVTSVKTWKRSDRVVVGLRYGLREYWKVDSYISSDSWNLRVRETRVRIECLQEIL
jgi:hypothetical protein